MYVTETMKLGLGRVDNNMGKGENADNQHFLFFSLFFQKVLSEWVL